MGGGFTPSHRKKRLEKSLSEKRSFSEEFLVPLFATDARSKSRGRLRTMPCQEEETNEVRKKRRLLKIELNVDKSGDIGDKSFEEELVCGMDVEAALAHVVDGFGVGLSDGGSVGAVDVVGVDFELGLGEDSGGVGEEDVAALLDGFGALGVGGDVYAAGEAADGPVGGDAFDQCAAAAVRV